MSLTILLGIAAGVVIGVLSAIIGARVAGNGLVGKARREAAQLVSNAEREAERQTSLRERGFVSTSKEESARTEAQARRASCDAAIGAGHPGNMPPDMFLDRRGPWHQLEAEAVVDHGEAARRECKAPAVRAGDKFTFSRFLEWHTGLGRERVAERVQLALPERTDQVPVE